jgi:hypothetical protein
VSWDQEWGCGQWAPELRAQAAYKTWGWAWEVSLEKLHWENTDRELSRLNLCDSGPVVSGRTPVPSHHMTSVPKPQQHPLFHH